MLLIEFVKIRAAYSKPKYLLIIMFLAFTLFNEEALAKSVNNSTAVEKLTLCVLADDADDKVLKDGSYACCSKSEGFCIWCPTSADKNCVVKPTKITTPGETHPFITTINPAFFDDLTGDTSPDDSTLSPIKNFLLRKKAESIENKNYDSGDVEK